MQGLKAPEGPPPTFNKWAGGSPPPLPRVYGDSELVLRDLYSRLGGHHLYLSIGGYPVPVWWFSPVKITDSNQNFGSIFPAKKILSAINPHSTNPVVESRYPPNSVDTVIPNSVRFRYRQTLPVNGEIVAILAG